MAERKLSVLITGNAKSAQKAFGDLDKTTSRSAKKSQKSLAGMTKGVIGVGVAAAAWKAFDGWNESQKIIGQTEAVIKSTGAAANVTAGEINDLAKSISLNTGIHDEAIQTGQNMLLTFTKIRDEAGEGNDIFTQATKIMVDLSVAMGTDAKTAAVQLGKALNDPTVGMTALSRSGITFSAQQKAMVKDLQESGDMLGAQKIILGELTTQFEGSAEAQATSMDKAKVSISNMSDEIMGVLAPAIESMSSGVATAAEGFNSMPSTVKNATVGVAAFALLAPKILSVGRAAKATAVDLRNMGGAAGKATRGVGILAAGVAAYAATSELLNDSVKANGDIAKLTTDLTNLGRGAIPVADGVRATSLSLEELAEAFDMAANGSRSAWEQLTSRDPVGHAREFKQAKNDVDQLDKALAGMVDSGNAEGARAAFGQIAASMREAGVETEDIAKLMDDYWDAVQRGNESGLSGAVSGAASMMGDLGAVTGDTADATGDAAKEAKTYAEKLSDIEAEAKDATTAIEEFFGSQTAGTGSKIEAERALDDLSESIAENGLALSISGEAGRTNRESIIGARDAALDYATTVREQTGSSTEAAAAMHEYAGSLRQTLLDGGFTEAQVDSLIAEMGLTPTDITTVFHENATEAELKSKSFRDELNRITPSKRVNIEIDTAAAHAQLDYLSGRLTSLGSSVLSGTAGRAAQESLRERASGGPVSGGRPYLVGEEGPELIVPGMSGNVIPAGPTASMLAGSGARSGRNAGGTSAPTATVVNVHVAGTVTSERDLIETIETGIAKRTRLNSGLQNWNPWTYR